MRIFILFLFSFLLISACAPRAVKPSALEQAKLSFQKQDYMLASEQLRPLAQGGNAKAQYTLGYLYFYGKGVENDPYRALEWIRKSAQQGYEPAVKALDMLNQQHASLSPLDSKTEHALSDDD